MNGKIINISKLKNNKFYVDARVNFFSLQLYLRYFFRINPNEKIFFEGIRELSFLNYLGEYYKEQPIEKKIEKKLKTEYYKKYGIELKYEGKK